MENRTIIFHYHLFKNAGTSFDSILKRNFGTDWVSSEFPVANNNNTKAVEAWIASTPAAIAYSTHTAMGPPPLVEGVDIIPVIFLRDPIARIESAYRFERQQKLDSWGTNLARNHDLAGYVEHRLARKNDMQCRNFQTCRLAMLFPGPGCTFERALRGLDFIHGCGVVGLVDEFDASIQRLFQRIQPIFPDFRWQSTKANVSEVDSAPLSPDLRMVLESENQTDFAILAAAKQQIQSVTDVPHGCVSRVVEIVLRRPPSGLICA